MIDDFELLALRSPAGAGQENDPGDFEALDQALRHARLYEPPPEYADAPQRYATEPMIDAVKRLQSENALKVDGYANPGGPTERVINNALLAKPRGAGLLYEPLAPLTGAVGNGLANARADVAKVQRGLGALGYGPEDPDDRPHGLIDAATLGGVKRFQRDRSLTPDGWLAPGGETERALHEALHDLARAKGRDWRAYAERAGKARAKVDQSFIGHIPTDAAFRDVENSAGPIPAATDPWEQFHPGMKRHPLGPSTPAYGLTSFYPPIVPTTPPPGLGGFFRALPGLGFAGTAITLGEQIRQNLEGEQRGGTKAENIPPHVPNEPFRGPDPARPPLDPREASPPPYPAAPPKPAPDKVENIPTRIDPRDFILITPDQNESWAKYIFIERRGKEDTRGPLSIIAAAARNLGARRPDAKIVHVGGSRGEKGNEVPEKYIPNRDLEDQNLDARKGSSFGDITLEVDKKIIHISFYRAKADGSPKPIEIEQAIRLAYNTRQPNLIVMIENKYGKEAINQEAVERFLESIVDAVLAGAGDESNNVRDPNVRDRIIQYFDAYKPK